MILEGPEILPFSFLMDIADKLVGITTHLRCHAAPEDEFISSAVLVEKGNVQGGIVCFTC